MEGGWERRRDRPQNRLTQMRLRNCTYAGCGSEHYWLKAALALRAREGVSGTRPLV